jgi:hypothetical protein
MNRAAVQRVERTRASGVLVGDGRKILSAINRAGSPSQYDRTRKAWLVPLAKLDAVLAELGYGAGGLW